MRSNYTPSLFNYDNYNIHQKALLCAYLCQISYMNETDMLAWGEELEIHSNKEYIIKFSSSHSIQFNVICDNDYQFITFRGTDVEQGLLEALQDLWVSMKIIPTKYNDAYIHIGYKQASNEVWESIQKLGIISNTKKTIVCGHSLGGALGKFVSQQIEGKFDLFTFGSPQISKGDFFTNSNMGIEAHYLNGGDIIPKFPSLLFNDNRLIYHMKEEGKNFDQIYMKSSGLIIPFLSLVYKTLTKKQKKIFDDHSITAYVIHLHRLLKTMDYDNDL